MMRSARCQRAAWPGNPRQARSHKCNKRRELLLENLEERLLLASDVDLVITDLSAPAAAVSGDTIAIRWTVQNQGTTASRPALWRDFAYLSSDTILDDGDTVLGAFYPPSSDRLGAGASYTLSDSVTLYNATPGTRYLLIVTDHDRYQPETDKTNNVLARAIEIQAPDLAVSDAMAPASAAMHQTIPVSFIVHNQSSSVSALTDYTDALVLSNDPTFDGFAIDKNVQTFSAADRTPLAGGDSYTISQDVTIPAFNAGSRYLLFVADVSGSQGETDETNNIQVLPIALAAPDVDLQITPTSHPATAAVYQTFDVSWTVSNARSESTVAPFWYDVVYLSTDNTLDNTDLAIVFSFAIAPQIPLAGGTSYNVTKSATIPNTTAGSHYLLFTTDRYSNSNFQGETDETNNVVSVPIEITGPDVDLTVVPPTVPPVVVAGQALDVPFSVRNEGTEPAVKDWYDYVYISDDVVLDTSRDKSIGLRFVSAETPLAGGLSYGGPLTVSIPADAGTGTSYLLFVTDKNNAQYETDETNNVVAVAIDVEKPDLIVPAPTASAPPSASVGERISVSWTVTNQGSVFAPGSWYDAVFLSDDVAFDVDSDTQLDQYRHNAPPLDANGGSYQVTQTVNLDEATPGSKYLLIVADAFGQRSETDETNNVRALPIEIKAPDLEVTAASAPDSAVIFQTIDVSWTVINHGPGSAAAGWDDVIAISDDMVFDDSDTTVDEAYPRDHIPLAAGASYTTTLTVRIPNTAAGNRYLLVVADGFEDQGETDETNNVYAQPILLTPPDVDLVISAIVPAEVSPGQYVEGTYTVLNDGSEQADTHASPVWRDKIYLSDDATPGPEDTVLFNEPWYTPLDAQASYTVPYGISIPNTAVTGKYLLFVTDAENRQAETNKTNNIVAAPTSAQVPDLVVSDASSPASAALGETIPVSWLVTNLGPGAALADWQDAIYLSDDATLDGSDIALDSESITAQTPLGKDSGYTIPKNITIPDTATGSRYLLFVVNAGQAQGETDYVNNVLARPIELKAADLKPTDLGSPVSAALGETITVSWTVLNRGPGDAVADWSDAFFVSDDTTLDPSDLFVRSFPVGDQTPLLNQLSYSLNRDLTIPDTAIGNRYLLVVTDHGGDQFESDNGNNVLARPIEITGADLLVPPGVNAPASAVLGNSVAVSWSVANQGNGPASAGWFDSIFISDDTALDGSDLFLASFSAADETPLAAGSSYDRTRDVLIPNTAAGNRYLLIVADQGNGYVPNGQGQYQPESDETNNTRAVPIQLRAADLIVSDVSAPLEVFSGQRIDITWRITNRGDAPATGAWKDRVYLSDDGTVGNDLMLGEFDFAGSIDPDRSILRTQTVTVPIDLSGPRYVVIETDAGDSAVAEGAAESNNNTVDDRQIDVRSSPFPNLQVSGVTAGVSSVTLGDAFQVSWTVNNAGTGPTDAPQWSDYAYFSVDQILDSTDVYIGGAVNPSYLSAGQGYPGSAVATARGVGPGDYYVLVMADARGQVFEYLDEADNVGVGPRVHVDRPPPPDLVVTQVHAPDQAFSGQAITLAYTVGNTGAALIAPQGWFDDVYMSADDVLNPAEDRRLTGVPNSTSTFRGTNEYTSRPVVTLPAGVSGTFYFFVAADATNQLDEFAFETNNSGYDPVPTTINLTPPPDLEASGVGVADTALAGHSMTVSYHVTNFGSTATPNDSWSDAFYLSEDSQFDPTVDLLLGQRTHLGALAVDGSYDATASLTLPNGLSGPRYVFVAVDADNGVFELNDGNNVAPDAAPVLINSLPADLVVASAAVSGTPAAGGSITITWTVRNRGDGDTIVGTWADQIIASRNDALGDGDDTVLALVSHTGALDPRQSYGNAATVGLPFEFAGSYSLFVVSDAGNAVFEADNESNNASSAVPIQVTRETADLELLPTRLAAENGRLRLEWTVTNSGANRTSSEYWHDGIYASPDDVFGNGNDLLLDSVYHSGALAHGGQYAGADWVELPRSLSGLLYFFIRADADNQVLEESDSNNTQLAGQLDVATLRFKPDLIVSSITAPAEALSAQEFDVAWEVRNVGDFIDPPGTPPERLRPELRSGHWRDVVFLSRDQVFDAGSDYFLGERTARMEDLVPVTGPGDPYQVYTRSATFRVPAGLTGPLYVFVATDRSDEVLEADGEANNTAYDPTALVASLAPPADLLVGSVTIPQNAPVGSNVSLSYTLENLGTNAARGSWWDRLYLSSDDHYSADDVPLSLLQHREEAQGRIEPGGSLTVHAGAGLPAVLPGDYFLIVRSDVFNVIPESNETNNLRASLDSFTVSVPEIALSDGAGSADVDTFVPHQYTQALYFRFDAPQDETIAIEALFSDIPDVFVHDAPPVGDHFETVPRQTVTAAYVAFGRVPTPFAHDLREDEWLRSSLHSGDAKPLVIPRTQAGTYFVRLDVRDTHPDFSPGSSHNSSDDSSHERFRVSVHTLPFSLLEAPTQVGNAGPVTMRLVGSQLDASTTFRITRNGDRVLSPTQVQIQDPMTAFVTFDLTGQPPTGSGGSGEPQNRYRVVVTNASGETSGLDLVVLPGVGPRLGATLNGPAVVRLDHEYVFYANYGNNGDADAVAPLLIVQGPDGVPFGLSRDDLAPGRTLQVLGISGDGPAGVLRAGELGSIPFFYNTNGGTGRFLLHTITADDNRPIDFQQVEAAIRPPDLPDDLWNAIWPDIQARLGNTWGDYVRALADMATFLSVRGQRVVGVAELFRAIYFEELFEPSGVIGGHVLDAATHQPAAGAQVTLRQVIRGDNARLAHGTTDPEGRFRIEELHAGTWEVFIRGFYFDTIPTVTLRPGEAATDLMLSPKLLPDPDPQPSAEPPHLDQADPALAIDASGVPHMIWTHNQELWHASYNGSAWVGAGPIPGAIPDSYAIQAAGNLIDGQAAGILVTWRQGQGNNSDIYYSLGRARAGGAYEWSAPINLTLDSAYDDSPTVVVTNSGRVLLVSQKYDDTLQDDADLYARLVEIGSAGLIWPAGVATAALAGTDDLGFRAAVDSPDIVSVGFGYQNQLPSWIPLIGGKKNIAVLGVLNRSKNCEVAKISGFVQLKAEVADDVEFAGELNASLSAAAEPGGYSVNEFKLGGAISGSVDIPFVKIPVPMPPIPLGIVLVDLGDELAKFSVGASFGFGLSGSYKWTVDQPAQANLYTDLSVGAFGKAKLLNKIRVQAKVLGTARWEAYPRFLTFKRLTVTMDVLVTAGPWGGAMTAVWIEDPSRPTGSSLQLSAASEPFALETPRPGPTTQSLSLHYGPHAGTGTVYGSGSILSNVASDLSEDGPATLAKAPNGDIYLAWAKDADPASPGPLGDRVLVSRFDGTRWNEPVELPGSRGFSDKPAIGFGPGGEPIIVWSMADTSALTPQSDTNQILGTLTRNDVVFSTYRNGAWSTPVPIWTANGRESEVVVSVSADGRLLATWKHAADSGTQLMAAFWDGNGWTTPEAVDVGAITGPAAITQLHGNTVLFWTQDVTGNLNNNDPSIFQSTFNGHWSEPTAFDPVAAATTASGADFGPSSSQAEGSTARFRASDLDLTDWLYSVDWGDVPSDCSKKPKKPPQPKPNDPRPLPLPVPPPPPVPTPPEPPQPYEPRQAVSLDPNDIIGPTGFGSEAWVSSSDTLPYMIRFENKADASGPAQRVVITQALDDDLDVRSFRVADFGWGDQHIELDAKQGFYQGRIDLFDTLGYAVDITASVDVQTGLATWVLSTVDPQTGESPADALLGFLPPNDSSGIGEGFVTYTIRPKHDVTTGARIDARARVVFDTNEPIDTPGIANALDSAPPTSAVDLLSAATAESTFLVSWSGRDDEGGSALADFAIYVSDNGGPFVRWLVGTSLTEALYTGEPGHAYAFYSVARDNAGNIEAPPATPDAQTHVGALPAGEIHGQEFNDLDGDGTKDAGEPGLADWTIFLDLDDDGLLDTEEPSTVTDANGAYVFTALAPGSYVVAEVMQQGWMQTSPGPGGSTSAAPVSRTALGDVRVTIAGVRSSDETTPSSLVSAERAGGLIALDAFRADPRFAGIDGSGLSVVILDTGIDPDHPFFGADGDSNGVADSVVYQWDFVHDDADASDDHGHGSHVSSIVASRDLVHRGVAPSVNLIELKVLDSTGSGSFASVERALEWVIAHAAQYRIAGVNMSFGDGGNYSTPQLRAGISNDLAALAALGVIVVSASGNDFYADGSRQGVAYPSADPNSLSIGAVWSADAGGPFTWKNGARDLSTAADRIVSFSQRDDGLSDAFAPGALIAGAGLGGGVATFSGTSMAAPYVTGVAALAQQLALDKLGRRLTLDEFRSLLVSTATIIKDGDDERDNVTNTGLSFARVDVLALAEGILALAGGAPLATIGSHATTGEAPHDRPARSPVIAGSRTVQVAAGDVLDGIDFGNFRKITIRGSIYEDHNGNGLQDTEDQGLAGWTLFLDADDSGTLDAGEASTQTDAQGNYAFLDLGPGTYRVRQVVEPGWFRTTGNPETIFASSGGDVANADIGDTPARPGKIKGHAFEDMNGDQRYDAGEPLLAGWVVLLDSNGNGIPDPGERSKLTRPNGTYSFKNLDPGDHAVVLVSASGFVAVPMHASVPPGGVARKIDVAAYQPGRIRGKIFHDDNRNGAQDADEARLPGWTVFLDLDGDGSQDPNEPSKVSNGTGKFVFPDLAPGLYHVTQMVQQGWVQTAPADAASRAVRLLSGARGRVRFGNDDSASGSVTPSQRPAAAALRPAATLDVVPLSVPTPPQSDPERAPAVDAVLASRVDRGVAPIQDGFEPIEPERLGETPAQRGCAHDLIEACVLDDVLATWHAR